MPELQELKIAPQKTLFSPQWAMPNAAKMTLYASDQLLTPPASARGSTAGASISTFATEFLFHFRSYGVPATLSPVNDRITFFLYTTSAQSWTLIDVSACRHIVEGFISVYLDNLVDVWEGAAAPGALLPFCGASVALPADEDDADEEPDGTTSAALAAADELTDFLHISYALLGQIVELGRTTFPAWRRGVRPRPSSVTKLFALQSLVSTLRRRLGERESHEWFTIGSMPRIRRLIGGEWDAVQEEGQRLLLEGAPLLREAGFAPEPDIFVRSKSQATLEVTKRKPRRVVLSTSDR